MQSYKVETLAGTGSNRSADGPRLRANLGAPTGMYCLGEDVYICDYYGNSIRKLDLKTETMTTEAGNGQEGGEREGPALTTSLPTPRYLFPDGTGGWIITSYVHAQIIQFKDGVLKSVAGASESGFVDGEAANARFDYPRGGCADPRSGSLYITDYGNHRVRVISTDGIVSSIGSGNKACIDGKSSVAAFNGPLDLCPAPNGGFYVCELGAVRIIDATSHEVTTYAGAEACGMLDGPRLSARFSGLTALAWRNDTMFLADFNNHVIRKISPTGMVTTFAGSPTKGFLDGPALDAQFQFPWGLCLTSEGHLLISDSSNNRIRIMKNVTDPIDPPLQADFDCCTFAELQTLESGVLQSPSASSNNDTFLTPLNIHFALAELVYPSILSQKTMGLLNSADASSPAYMALATYLYTNSVSENTSMRDVVDIIYFVKILGLPEALLPALLSYLSDNLPKQTVNSCIDLLGHISEHCAADDLLCQLTVAAVQPRLQAQDVPSACKPLMKNNDFAVKVMQQLLNPASIQLPPHFDMFPGWFILRRLEELYWTLIGDPVQEMARRQKIKAQKLEKPTPPPKKSKKRSNKDVATVSKESNDKKQEEEEADKPITTLPIVPACLERNFTLAVDDKHEIKVHDWVLYSRWPYFRHLAKSGLVEAKDRRLELPSDSFSPPMLDALVKYLYTNQVDAFDTTELRLSLLRAAPQFNLVDLLSPPTPSPHFKRLIAHCQQVLSDPCTLENCVSQYKIIAEMGSAKQLNYAGSFILDHFPTLSQNPVTLAELKTLSPQAFGEMWLRSRGRDPGEWLTPKK